MQLLRPLSDELLPAADKDLVLLLHPGMYTGLQPSVSRDCFPYERNPRSRAYISLERGQHYFMGSLQGGRAAAYENFCLEMRRRTDEDLAENIIALWHDESHINRYAADNPEKVQALSADVAIIERHDGSWSHKTGAVIIREKSRPRWGGHAWLRGALDDQITVRLSGQLGNQLFQYFAATALYAKHAEKNPDVCVDASLFKGRRVARSTQVRLTKIFPTILVRTTMPGAYEVYAEECAPSASFDENVLNLPPAIILEGFFQNYRYFEIAKPYILKNLRLSAPPNWFRALQEQYELIAVHVQNGDSFIKKNWPYHDTASSAYYRAALAEVEQNVKNPYILVFSDDVARAGKLLDVSEFPHMLIEHAPGEKDTDIKDFSLMAQCKHFIISNSSCGFAAALVASRSDSLCFAPLFWDFASNIQTKEVIPPSWKIPEYAFYDKPPSKQPPVSIIIPVYNTENYLERCLESVCTQTEQNIEIIVVDDASPDGSAKIIEAYAKRDPRIIALRHENNKRLGGARNTGIEAARGEYILFVDSDDYIREDAVSLMLEKARSNPNADFISCGIYKVSESDGALSTLDVAPMNHDEFVTDVLQRYIDGTILHCAWAKLWRRDLWTRTGFRFPEQTMEDMATVPLLFAKVHGAVIMPERLFYYQQRESSITTGDSQLFIENQMKAFVWQQEKWGAMNVASPLRELLVWRIASEIWRSVVELTEYGAICNSGTKPFQELFVDIMRRPDLSQFFARIMDDAGPMRGAFLAVFLALQHDAQQQRDAARADKWYVFGRYSHKCKAWVVLKTMAKKLRVGWLLKPIAFVGRTWYRWYKTCKKK